MSERDGSPPTSTATTTGSQTNGDFRQRSDTDVDSGGSRSGSVSDDTVLIEDMWSCLYVCDEVVSLQLL